MINGLIRFFWTSGRKCNFDGCEREDLQPAIVNGRINHLSAKILHFVCIAAAFCCICLSPNIFAAKEDKCACFDYDGGGSVIIGVYLMITILKMCSNTRYLKFYFMIVVNRVCQLTPHNRRIRN